MHLSRLGKIVEQYWQEIPKHYPNVTLDTFQIMPDHVHGIIVIEYAVRASVADVSKSVRAAYMPNAAAEERKDCVGAIGYVGVQNFKPRHHRYQHTLPKSVGSIVRAYKASVTQWSKEHDAAFTVWQRNFYERVIRNYEEWEMTRTYIRQNPERWESQHIIARNNPLH